jgi:hypothetical protein
MNEYVRHNDELWSLHGHGAYRLIDSSGRLTEHATFYNLREILAAFRAFDSKVCEECDVFARCDVDAAYGEGYAMGYEDGKSDVREHEIERPVK